MLLSDGITQSLFRGLVIGLVVAAIRGAIWLLRHASNTTIISSALGLIGVSLGILIIVPQETDYRRLAQNPETSLYRYTAFLKKHPHSYRLGSVDDLLWNWAAKMEAPGPANQYLDTFPNGRHAAELKSLIASRKASQLAALRTKPDPKMAAQFMRWFPDAPETAEVRRILIAAVEQRGAGTPPPAIFRRLIESFPSGKVPYSIVAFENNAGESDTHIRDFAQEIRNRLTIAFRAFGVIIEEKKEDAAIRVEGAVFLDKAHSYQGANGGDHGAHPEMARAQFSIYLPGEKQPVWTGTLEAQSPDVYGKYAPAQSDVQVNMLISFRQALQQAFRYWDP